MSCAYVLYACTVAHTHTHTHTHTQITSTPANEKALFEAAGKGDKTTGGDKWEQACAKMASANDLQKQCAFEEALALYQEALELFTEVRFQYATSMCAYACIALHRGLIFHDLYVSRATGFAFCCPLLTFCFYYRWAATTPRTWPIPTSASVIFTTVKVSTSKRWRTTKRLSRSSSKFPARIT